MTVYIVRRDSADGPEIDCFEDRGLAEQWAKHIYSTVEEENTIDKAMLKELKKSYRDF